MAAGRHFLAHGRLERACAAAALVSRSSVLVLSRALLARCEVARGDREAARAQLDLARRELGHAVPMARALRALEEVAGELGSHATPLAAPPPA
jgi:hypothetical protein